MQNSARAPLNCAFLNWSNCGHLVDISNHRYYVDISPFVSMFNIRPPCPHVVQRDSIPQRLPERGRSQLFQTAPYNSVCATACHVRNPQERLSAFVPPLALPALRTAFIKDAMETLPDRPYNALLTAPALGILYLVSVSPEKML